MLSPDMSGQPMEWALAMSRGGSLTTAAAEPLRWWSLSMPFSTRGSRSALRHPMGLMNGPLSNASRTHHPVPPSFGGLRKQLLG